MFERLEFRAELVRNGITESELAEHIGISVPTLYKRYDNDANFRRKELAKICELIGTEAMLRIFFTV